MSVLVINHVSLDGVMQGPGRPDEDTRGGFAHGGWAESASDQATAEAMGRAMSRPFSWLFGRRSYEDMLSHWNQAGGPFKDGLNQVPKFVASSDPSADLPWPNSTLITGDVPARVAQMREQQETDLVVMGSGQLVRSLLPHGLVDKVLLFVHPVLLGSGRRLFGSDEQARRLRLVESTATDTGVLIVTYELPLAEE